MLRKITRKDHSDDVPVIFGEEFIEEYKFCHGKYWSDDEKELSKRMMGAWAHFAKVGYSENSSNLYANHLVRARRLNIYDFRLEIPVLKNSKISRQANQRMFSRRQQIN